MDLNVRQSPSLGKGMTEDDDRKEMEIRTEDEFDKDWKAEWLFVNDSIRWKMWMDESLTLPDRAQWWWCGGGGDFLFSRPSVAGYGGRRAPVRMRVSALLLPAGWAYTLTLSNYLSHISPPHHRSQPQQHQQKIVSFHQNFPQEHSHRYQGY